MAAGYLAAPGTPHGPCALPDGKGGFQDAPCSHTDCAQTRAMADAQCQHGCGEKIGYDTGFFLQEKVTTTPITDRLVHAACEYKAIEGDG